MSTTGNTVRMSKTEFAALQEFAREGQQYRADLKAEIRGLANQLEDRVMVAFALETIGDVARLKALRNEYRRRWDAKMPPRPQATLPSGDPARFTRQELDTWERLGIEPAEAAKYREEM